MKRNFLLLGCVLVAAVTLTAGGMPPTASVNAPLPETLDTKADYNNLLPGGKNAEQIKFWTINEFESWMKEQHDKNQKLADSGDTSFYEKDVDGNYVRRAWTLKDVDALYVTWQKQLALMKQGYHFTKPVILSDGGSLAGAFNPETWNADSATSPGSTVIVMPDASVTDLGHFDNSDTARKAVEEYLRQQVTDGHITQQEADTILANASIE